MPEGFLFESLMRYIGQTVTIFTTSGGVSGCGFTGVLASVCGGTVKLITDIGAAPACPIGSSCCCNVGCCGNSGYGGGYGGYSYGGGYGGYGYGGYGGYGSSPYYSGCGCSCGSGYGYGNNCCVSNILGSVTEIPVDRIVSFTHNAI